MAQPLNPTSPQLAMRRPLHISRGDPHVSCVDSVLKKTLMTARPLFASVQCPVIPPSRQPSKWASAEVPVTPGTVGERMPSPVSARDKCALVQMQQNPEVRLDQNFGGSAPSARVKICESQSVDILNSPQQYQRWSPQHMTRNISMPSPLLCKNCIIHEQENRQLRLILQQHERNSAPIGGRRQMCAYCAGFQQDIRELSFLVERLRAQVDVTESRKRNNFEKEAKELRAEVAQLRAKLKSAMNNSGGDSADSKAGADKESPRLLRNAVEKINRLGDMRRCDTPESHRTESIISEHTNVIVQ